MKTKLGLFSLVLLLAASVASAQSSNYLVVPAAGDVVGGNGTHFRSDITLYNLRGDASQRVELRFAPQGGSVNPPRRTLTLAPLSIISSENFVADVLGASGLGAMTILAVDANGNLDPNGKLYATSRIWTPQPPDGAGTTSQSMPVLPQSEVNHTKIVFVGHRQLEQYRNNVGIANFDATTTQTFRVTVSGSIPTLVPVIFDVTLPPMSMSQSGIQWPTPDPELRVEVEVLPQPGGGRGTFWLAYMSSVDNVTGDSWSTLGVETAPR
ncbi:MAG TPA: hypothetical protein VF618_12590 [Thermoanaerobaculia bacterium]